MVETKLQIINTLGLHARAAAKLVHTASNYSCEVILKRDDDEVDAKSILGILQLGAAKGTEIHINCNGEDEEAAIEALTELINDRFGEEN